MEHNTTYGKGVKVTEPKRGSVGFEVGEKNRKRIWNHFHKYPFSTQKECAEKLGLSAMAVSRAIKVIKEGWTPPVQEVEQDAAGA